MTHLWVRAEPRANEARVGITPEGVANLKAQGLRVSVEESTSRAIGIEGYRNAGAEIVPEGSWTDASHDAVIFGLKELPDDGTPLPHTHIMFGHAYKGQPDGQVLLRRFREGGGTLLDLEYLTDDTNRRVAAFGYWAGYAGAAVALKCWAAQQRGGMAGPVHDYSSAPALLADLQADLSGIFTRPTAIIIGAKGRVGSGAGDLCTHMGVPTTLWDMAETAHGGPFPEILSHDIIINAILARPGTPVLVPQTAPTAARRLSVIGDVACDPGSDFNPIPVYDRVTNWEEPALRVHEAPPLDVTAIDNLPAMLPTESSEDFAEQLLPSLRKLPEMHDEWARAAEMFRKALHTLA
ncbi:MAG: saccharopine dehydrogenase [Rhodobacteraceae bacterium]|nr:saccharopine dehydrogenase [Paracoccaceae bacterium]